VKQDNADDPAVHAVTYQAEVRAREEVLWGTVMDDVQTRFIAHDPQRIYGFRNREITKAGETRQIKYTIVFQKKEGKWTDQFGNSY
jgi:hypothetical protein